MTWNNETASPLNGWFGMQEKMLKGWWDLLAQPSPNGHGAPTANPLWEMWMKQGMEQWQTLYQENFMATSQQAMADVTKSLDALKGKVGEAVGEALGGALGKPDAGGGGVGDQLRGILGR